MNVPGKKTRVSIAILNAINMSHDHDSGLQPNAHVIIAELSLCVSVAMSLVKWAMLAFVPLSLCVARLKKRWIRIFVRSFQLLTHLCQLCVRDRRNWRESATDVFLAPPVDAVCIRKEAEETS